MPSVMLSDGFWLVVLGWLFFTLLQSTLIYKARWNFSIARACPSEVRNNQPIQFPLFTHHKKCHALAWFLTRIIETFSLLQTGSVFVDSFLTFFHSDSYFRNKSIFFFLEYKSSKGNHPEFQLWMEGSSENQNPVPNDPKEDDPINFSMSVLLIKPQQCQFSLDISLYLLLICKDGK